MKKKVIAIILSVLTTLLLIILSLHLINSHQKKTQTNSTTDNYNKVQLGVTVDSWLKIIEIDEYYGRLAVVVENVSDKDIEYAELIVKTRENTLSFNVSALLSGTKAVLLCNDEVGKITDEVYTGWQTENLIYFDNKPEIDSDNLEISIKDGSILVKNISGQDIKSDILIFYKDKKDDLVNGSVTYKTRLKGLKAGSQTFIKTPDINKKNCKIIFTTYEDKEV